MRMEDKITLRREIVMQENAAKIRVKTGNSGAFTEKIEKNQKNFEKGIDSTASMWYNNNVLERTGKNQQNEDTKVVKTI